jgi:hypothetical protein
MITTLFLAISLFANGVMIGICRNMKSRCEMYEEFASRIKWRMQTLSQKFERETREDAIRILSGDEYGFEDAADSIIPYPNPELKVYRG